MKSAARCSIRYVPFLAAVVLAAAVSLSLSLAIPQAHAAAPGKPAIASASSPAPGKLTVKVKAAKGAKGYQYQASTSSKFDKPATYYIESTTTSSTAATFSDLKEGKTYYVRVRAYAKKGSYGKWSAVKQAKARQSTALADARAEAAKYKKELAAAQAEIERLKGSAADGTVTITYNLDGGSLPDGAKVKLASTDGDYTLPEPVRQGFSFEGWFDSAGKKVATASYFDGNLTVTARWSKMELAYIYVDAGRRSETDISEWDEQTQSYVGKRIYELYIDEGEAAPVVGDQYGGGTVVEVLANLRNATRAAGSVTLLTERKCSDADSINAYGPNGPFLPSLQDCTSIDLAKLDVSSVENFDRTFADCTALASLDLSGWDTSNMATAQSMFARCSSLSSLNLSGWNTVKLRKCAWMFNKCSSLKSIDLSGWDTRNVTDTHYMFDGCSSLASLDLSGWDTSKVTDMTEMFIGCSSLKSLDLSGWDTSSLTASMECMFGGCSSLESLSLSRWDMRNTPSVSDLFSSCTSSLVSLDVTGLQPPENCGEFFQGFSSLVELKGIENWDTSQVANYMSMFYGCSSLESLDLSGFDTSNAEGMYGMFEGCSSLISLKTGCNWTTTGNLADYQLPTFPHSMTDEAGVKWEEDDAIPGGSHSYTATIATPDTAALTAGAI